MVFDKYLLKNMMAIQSSDQYVIRNRVNDDESITRI